MNKSLLKNFATAARVRLMDDVRYRLGLMGITAKGIAAPIHQTLDMEAYEYARGQTYRLTGEDVAARRALADMVRAHGFEQVVEEVAYTWFNRLIAIRFMEVNDYLPHHTRVLSSAIPGQNTPDIVTRALDIDLGLTDREKQQVLDWKLSNQTDELFRFMFLKQCQQLAGLLPGLFGGEEGGGGQWVVGSGQGVVGSGYSLHTTPYSLLLTISYINPDGIVVELLKIPESYFDINSVDEDGRTTGQVEIIGWMYQYYNSELKDQTFAQLKGSNKISKERIPAATQLFTPQWIVKYLVENSPGRLWVEKLLADGDSRTEAQIARSFGWRYYLPEAEQPPEVAEQLKQMRKRKWAVGSDQQTLPSDNCSLTTDHFSTPEDLRFLDPCMGSGHILVYAFDVLMQIYLSCGYTQRNAARLVVQKNITGIDIDERAWQLSYFAVMMKARQYSQHAFQDIAYVGLFHMQETTGWNDKLLDFIAGRGGAYLRDDLDKLKAAYAEAKTLGSIIRPPDIDTHEIQEHYWGDIIGHHYQDLEEISLQKTAEKLFKPVLLQHIALEKQYHAVVTNPPYMGSGSMNHLLSSFVKEEYPDSKADLFAVFIERCGEMTVAGGYTAMITQHAWMFLSSYEQLRQKMNQRNIINMAHLGARAFDEIGGEVVQTTAFVTYKPRTAGYLGTYARLIEPTTQDGKEEMFLAGENRFVANQNSFKSIPGTPVAYWVSRRAIHIMNNEKRIIDFAKPCHGMSTGNNDQFLKQWYEVPYQSIMFNAENLSLFDVSKKKYAPYRKGGEYRLWYGNNDYVIAYDKNSRQLMESLHGYRSSSAQFFFIESINWSDASNNFGARYSPKGFIFDGRGASLFCSDQIIRYLHGLLCSVVAKYFLSLLNPTLMFNIGNIENIPVVWVENKKSTIDDLVRDCIRNSKEDWDSFEISWDFETHPLVYIALQRAHWNADSTTIQECYTVWRRKCEERFQLLKRNEEEINHIFIEAYGMQVELSPEVAPQNVTIRRAEKEREVRSLISYAVGCMFGRYHMEDWGLQFAGGDWTSFYQVNVHNITNDDGQFSVDIDGILPITDEEYFADDVVEKLVDFVRIAFGKQHLEENLRFVADALGGSGTPRDVIRNYFLKDFYKDHVKTYKKRPIYWLFDSGRQNGFKALIYMHRYDRDTLGRVRVDYLHRLQGLYENAVGSCDNILASSASAAEKGRATKRREKLLRQLDECRVYDQALAHLAGQRIQIDLDDGVKHNYALFQGVELARDGRRAVKVDLLAGI